MRGSKYLIFIYVYMNTRRNKRSSTRRNKSIRIRKVQKMPTVTKLTATKRERARRHALYNTRTQFGAF
jgi:hypothetical protein